MRAAHHSDLLELELATRRVPFRKYGGLRFLEAAHVKDYVAVIRVLVNPGDDVSWFRLLRMHGGIGSSNARSLAETLTDRELHWTSVTPTQSRKRPRKRGLPCRRLSKDCRRRSKREAAGSGRGRAKDPSAPRRAMLRRCPAAPG